MSENPVVSVIIPTYNRSQLLPGAIDSVLAQSYPYVEIIVIDDGSTDDTKQVLEAYGDRIRCLESDHSGISHSRNLGMKAATGKYVAFLDSDDQYYPYKLAVQVDFIEAHPEIGMVYSEFSAFSSHGYFDEYHLQAYHSNYRQRGWNYEDVFPVNGTHLSADLGRLIDYYIGEVFKYTLMGTFISTNTMLFPRSNLERIGYQNESYPYGEDYEFSVRMCKQYTVGFLNLPTYKLLYHDDQISRFAGRANSESVDDRDDIRLRIKGYEILGKAVWDWGRADETYYRANQEIVDSRLQQLHCQIGEQWLKYGDLNMAKACFRDALKYGPLDRKYRKYYWLSFTTRHFCRFGICAGKKIRNLGRRLSGEANELAASLLRLHE